MENKVLQQNDVRAVSKYIRMSPSKIRRVLREIQGKTYAEALTLLEFMPYASCAPIIKVLHENIGINHGSITTIHNLTNSQTLVDIPHNDLRRGRSAINNLIPTTTGSAKAISLIYPELKGRLNGNAVRVPILNSSLTDCVFEMKSSTNKDQINNLLKSASENELKNILGYEERPLVSTDFINDPRSSVIDSLSTMVVNDTQVKIYAWYDNEWGYANRLVDIVNMVLETS